MYIILYNIFVFPFSTLSVCGQFALEGRIPGEENWQGRNHPIPEKAGRTFQLHPITPGRHVPLLRGRRRSSPSSTTDDPKSSETKEKTSHKKKPRETKKSTLGIRQHIFSPHPLIDNNTSPLSSQRKT